VVVIRVKKGEIINGGTSEKKRKRRKLGRRSLEDQRPGEMISKSEHQLDGNKVGRSHSVRRRGTLELAIERIKRKTKERGLLEVFLSWAF